MPGRRNPDDDLSVRIKRWREEKGWSKVTLASKLKVSRQQVHKWENGTARPSGALLERLLALGLPPRLLPLPSVPRSSDANVSSDYSRGFDAGFQRGLSVGIRLGCGDDPANMPSGS